MEKKVDKASFSAPGEILTYTVVVTNTGKAVLTDVAVTDTKVDLGTITPVESINADGSLEVGETWTYTYEYEVTQADLDAGLVLNAVFASSNEVKERVKDEAETPADQKPDYTIVKTAEETEINEAGIALNYTVVLTNTGNVTLTDVVVKDSLVDLTGIAPVESKTSDGRLEVGETWTYMYSYTVTQADMNDGFVLNKVTSTTEEIPEKKEAEKRVPVDQLPALTVKKSVEETSFDAVGDVLNYKVVITNTGNITLTDVVVEDSKVDLSAITPVESMDADGNLEVGETWTYTYQYEVTQADLDAGSVLNSVSAKTRETEEPGKDDVEIPADQKPDYTILKTAEEAALARVGSVLNYEVVLTNTGNVTLTDVVVTDSLV